jgi:hypothetical protein
LDCFHKRCHFGCCTWLATAVWGCWPTSRFDEKGFADLDRGSFPLHDRASLGTVEVSTMVLNDRVHRNRSHCCDWMRLKAEIIVNLCV